MASRCRLFIDESGDHSIPQTECDVGRRYLGVVGTLFVDRRTYDEFECNLNRIKLDHFPANGLTPLVFHRADIFRKSGPFAVLIDQNRRQAFKEDLLCLIRETQFTVVGVVVDKLIHGRKAYRRLGHSYHYCLHAILERYCGLLARMNRTGDACVEARGRKEDQALQEVYRGVYEHGTRYLPKDRAQSTLSSSTLKVVRKEENSAGLQLADLIAHPVTRDVLRAYRRIPAVPGEFTNALLKVIDSKYNLYQFDGRVNGYGRVLL